MPYHINSSKKSTSNIPSTSFQNTDYIKNMPKPLFTNNNQPSPPTSQTFSFVIANIQNELNILETNFVINKNILFMIFIVTITLKRDFGFSKILCIKERKYENVFMISLHYIKYKSYSLIALKCIMCLKIILHIYLQNMHVLLHLEIKPSSTS